MAIPPSPPELDAPSQGQVSVVVPTRNSIRTIRRCVAAAQASAVVREVLVVDNASCDSTVTTAREEGARAWTSGPERSAQRNEGLAVAEAPVVAFLDSDQIVTRGLLEEACRLIEDGADAVILTEATVGTGFWTRVRALERSCYVGVDAIEACRVFRTDFVRRLGGFDETLDAFEDWDLTARTRAANARIARTENILLHDEGSPTLRSLVSKRTSYALWEQRYRSKHPELAARQLAPHFRSWLLVRQPRRLFNQPLVAAGVLLLKGLEFLAVRARRERRDTMTEWT